MQEDQMLGGILTAITIVSTGYSLVKELLSDVDHVRTHFQGKKRHEKKEIVKQLLEDKVAQKITPQIEMKVEEQVVARMAEEAKHFTDKRSQAAYERRRIARKKIPKVTVNEEVRK